MRTRLTELLGVEHPVMLAGMGGVSYSALVAAVSEAGGFGCLGASTMSTDQLVDEMRRVREATDRPFGVDLLTAAGDLTPGVEALIDGGASVFVAGLGVPRDVVERCHRAGGIFDGRGLAAALALGADGAWIGTRFIATPEARAVNGYKDTLLGLPEDGTVVSRAYTGKTCRVVRNGYTQWFEEHPDELQPFPKQLGRSWSDGANHLGGDPDTEGVDPEREFFPAGQGVGAIDELVPAGELVRRIVAEADEALGRMTALRASPVLDA